MVEVALGHGSFSVEFDVRMHQLFVIPSVVVSVVELFVVVVVLVDISQVVVGPQVVTER